MELTLRLNNGQEPLHLTASVVRVFAASRAWAYSYEVGVEFIDVAPATHERLVRSVLQAQYEMARKGTLGW
jgi:hypothetical protein